MALSSNSWSLARPLIASALVGCAGFALTSEDLPPNFPEEIIVPGQIDVAAGSDLLNQVYIASKGSKSIYHKRSERASTQDQWATIEDNYSVSFFITAFATRLGGNVFYIAGLKSNGDAIIEEWKLDLASGRNQVTSSSGSAAPPIGTALGTTSLYVEVSSAGWLPFSQRRPSPKKRVLYEGPSGPFSSMDADPEGRFLILYNHSERDLYRLVLSSTPPDLGTLMANEDHSQLSEVEGIQVRDFAGKRTWVVVRKDSNAFDKGLQWYTMLIDDDNDGEFDSHEFFTRQSYMASPYYDSSDWKFFWKL